MSPEKLKRRALALGAELEIDGKTINAGRQQLRVVSPKPPGTPAAVAPAPIADAAPQTATMAMIAQAMTLQMRVLAEMLERGKPAGPVLAAAPETEPPKPAAAPVPRSPPAAIVIAAPSKLILPVSFKVVRDRIGWLLDLKPTYGEVPVGSTLKTLATTTDERGLIATITPTYMN